MEAVTLLVGGLFIVWIFRKSITVWSQTAEDKSKVSAMKVSLQNRKDESEVVAEAKDIISSGYTGLDKHLEAFILHGKAIPTEASNG